MILLIRQLKTGTAGLLRLIPVVVTVCLALDAGSAGAQPDSGPERFRSEVEEIVSRPLKSTEGIVLFTGSSSIRIWKDIDKYFPNYNIVNRGFGGSQTTDLLYYADEIILTLQPSRIFIYEGDNDLASGKSSEQILATTDSLLQRIRTRIPAQVPVYFISPKPSVARWKLKDAYLAHSANLKAWTAKQQNVFYADGWSSLIDRNGNVYTDIFMNDNLHLNKKGYDLWVKGIRKFLP